MVALIFQLKQNTFLIALETELLDLMAVIAFGAYSYRGIFRYLIKKNEFKLIHLNSSFNS